MTEYSVTIYETIHHVLTVEAKTAEEASELAHELVSDTDRDILEQDYGYYTEADGFIDYQVEEIVTND